MHVGGHFPRSFNVEPKGPVQRTLTFVAIFLRKARSLAFSTDPRLPVLTGAMRARPFTACLASMRGMPRGLFEGMPDAA